MCRGRSPPGTSALYQSLATCATDDCRSAQVPTAHVYQATNTSFIQYSGNWTVLNDPLIPNQQHPAPYFEVENAPASFSFSFQGVGVAINGSRIWGSYAYDVVSPALRSLAGGVPTRGFCRPSTTKRQSPTTQARCGSSETRSCTIRTGWIPPRPTPSTFCLPSALASSSG